MNLLVMGLVVACAVAVGIGVMHAVRRRTKTDELLADTARGSAIFGVIGTAFAVLLAFVMFVAFESFNEARESSEAEAAEVSNIYRTAAFLPAPDKDELQGQMTCYARAVVFQEWEAMRDGDSAPAADGWVDAFDETLRGIVARTGAEESAFRELFTEDRAREEARRERLLEAQSIVSPPVWFILGIAGLATAGFALLFTDRQERFFVQASMIGVVAGLVSASLVLVWFLDHPYQDATGSVQPVEMERTLAEMDAQEPALALPCDEDGDPA